MKAAHHCSLSVVLDSIDPLLFVFLIFFTVVNPPPQAPGHVTSRTPVKTIPDLYHHLANIPSQSRGRHVKNKRVQASVKGAQDQGLFSPGRINPCDITDYVCEVVGAKTYGEHYQRSQSHAYGPHASPVVNVLQLGQDPDEVDVAECANQERYDEKHHADLQTHWQEDI